MQSTIAEVLQLVLLTFLLSHDRMMTLFSLEGDTLDKLTSEEVDRAVTLWASFLYTLGTIDLDFS